MLFSCGEGMKRGGGVDRQCRSVCVCVCVVFFRCGVCDCDCVELGTRYVDR
jgi:hypothetical protein